ncbi:DUF6452 family protein [Lacinutrix sp. Bg11-31]|uniref:DUF6452 family protein n=1 Tax=Lacinutrix sp. Bg11-31 TaxID=2057808 RepID=UPI000C300451|nr:DUF6452 family protein [Lacinutrix sp. Bg11-31]AUC81681.1 hypothetical protein CW733_05870 [Lacinutrix sp. Bg11-31]
MKKIITLLLLFVCIAFSCERDDICPEDTPTTPRMVVEFRNVTAIDNTKNVAGLRIEDFDDATRTLDDDHSITSEDQMLLPLKTDANETKYRVYKSYANTDGTITGNPDVITITYDTEEIYVSRACGYKTIYKNVLLTITPEAGTDNWMIFAAPENDNQSVINEDEIHYTIRH